jgi:transposase
MSLRPNGFSEIPAETARVAKAAFPKGCLAIRARDALGPLFTDEQFAELFAARGRPAWSPARLALVLVLQFAEGLTDPAGRRRRASTAGLEVRAGPRPL